VIATAGCPPHPAVRFNSFFAEPAPSSLACVGDVRCRHQAPASAFPPPLKQYPLSGEQTRFLHRCGANSDRETIVKRAEPRPEGGRPTEEERERPHQAAQIGRPPELGEAVIVPPPKQSVEKCEDRERRQDPDKEHQDARHLIPTPDKPAKPPATRIMRG